MIRVLAVLFSTIGSAAMATVDAWPALYDVAGVAADDVLNVRAEPDAGAAIVGTLDPTATDVEVIRVNEAETWGLVNTGELSGWVSMAYMDRQPDQWAGRFPSITSCFGTEPFWDLDAEETRTILSFLGEPQVLSASIVPVQPSNRMDRFGFMAGAMTGIIIEEACNDGMSDREYGLSVELIALVNGRFSHLSGCCTIQP